MLLIETQLHTRVTGSSINMTSHWSSDLVRDVSATSNRKNYVQWLKYVGVNFFSPNIKSGSTNFYHFLPAEKDVENELISKWTQKISCHYTSLIKGMVHGVFSLPFQKNFSSLQKKKNSQNPVPIANNSPLLLLPNPGNHEPTFCLWSCLFYTLRMRYL